MKYIFSFLLMMFLSTMNAQNLQFSQVLTIGITANANNTPVGIVPEGKVWKIEFARMGNGGYLEVNNFSVAGNSALGVNQFPIWLKAGDIITASGSSNSTQYYFLSIIEFILVP